MKRFPLPAACLATVLLAILPGLTQPAFAQADERVFYASVVDKNGGSVSDLEAKDFIIREDGQAREILRVAKDTDPMQIALLVDNSDAMRGPIADLRRAVTAFIDSVREGVQIALITTGERPTIVVDYTSDRAALKAGAGKLFTSTAFNYALDGIFEVSQAAAKRALSHPVIAVIAGVGDDSYRTFPDVLERLREGGASLHVLTLGVGVGGHDREVVVSSGTADTGGRNDVVLSPMGLETKAKQLAVELSSQYKIVFARPQRLIPPKSTEVSARRQELHARGMLVKTDKERQ